MVKVLGFGGSGHDWSVAAMENGKLLCAIAEERTSRKKYGIGTDLRRPSALTEVLNFTDWEQEDVDYAIACDLVPLPMVVPFRNKLTRIRHHYAHALSAFSGSGFQECAILIADHSGSPVTGNFSGVSRQVETITGWIGTDSGIELIFEVSGTHHLNVQKTLDYYQHAFVDNSLGEIYYQTSKALGFITGSNGNSVSDDGKTMGLSSFGSDRLISEFRSLYEFRSGSKPNFELRSSDLCNWLQSHIGDTKSCDFQCQADVAAAVQAGIEEIILRLAQELRNLTGLDNLALAGGCALNCKANRRLATESEYKNIFVFPAAGDDGIAIGCAVFGSMKYDIGTKDVCDAIPFLGTSNPEAVTLDEATIISLVNKLENGEIVAWFEGRSEFGPRALGHRSILADPRSLDIKTRLNAITKRREGFRPFAPAILASAVDDVFDLPKSAWPLARFMLTTAPVRPEWKDRIPAVLHVDKTARPQIVEGEKYPTLHKILTLWNERTGVPLLLNTSFNRAGEPIVESESDAINCYRSTDIDHLYLNGVYFEKQPKTLKLGKKEANGL